MWRRLSLVWSCVFVASCWSSEPLVLDTFTPDQWSRLTAQLKLPEIDACLDPATCDRMTALGKALFFDPALSLDGKTSCASCHDTTQGFADTRTPNNVSLASLDLRKDPPAVVWTKHNVIAVVNAAYKEQLHGTFGWTGGFKNSGGTIEMFVAASDVIDLANEKAMLSDAAHYKAAIRGRLDLRLAYELLWGPIDGQSEMDVLDRAKQALEAYLRRLRSDRSRFDQFVAGKLDALNESEQRGFVVFTTRGMCIDCHSGPLLSDFDYHVTGVPQVGQHVVAIDSEKPDKGRFEVTGDPADLGKFATPSLRDIRHTAPYMHDGAIATLREVIDFYNDGGGRDTFLGVKDPRLAPLDLDEVDERDLESFLGALDGARLDPSLTSPPLARCEGCL